MGGPRLAFRGWTPAGDRGAVLLSADPPGPSVTGTSSGLIRLDFGWFLQVVLYIFQQQVGEDPQKAPFLPEPGPNDLDLTTSAPPFSPPEIPHPYHVKGEPCP